MSQKIAVVTGGNKGIGYAIVKGLAPKFDGLVYLTARNEELGLSAVKELEKENVKARFHQLDIDNQESIDRFAKYLKEKHGGLDVLVNNAAIAFKAADTTTFDIQARESIRINYTDTLNVCNALFPLLRPHARVVNVSSRAGVLKNIPDESLKAKLLSEDLTIDELNGIMNNFVKLAQTDAHKNIHSSAYGMSKVGLTVLTRLQQKQFDKDPREDIVVSALCPGYVNTDMTSHKGFLTPEQGAETPIFLALLPENFNGPKGDFWAEKKVFDWTDPNWSFSLSPPKAQNE